MDIPSTFQIDFFDSEYLREAVIDSDVIYTQVAPGNFKGSIRRMLFPDIVIDSGNYNLQLLAEGATSQQTVSLIIIQHSDGPGKLWGEELQGGDIMVILEGAEVELTIPPNTFWTSISVSKELLDTYGLCITKNEIFSIKSREFQQFNSQCKEIISLFNMDTFSHTVLQDMLLSLLTKTLDHADNKIEISYQSSSLMALNIRDEILDHIDEEFQMKYLCQVTGKSVRTIERVFKRFFQLSPRQYHTCHRLLLIRQTLLYSKNISVSSAALKYGYFHLGRFSQKYKVFFGELPSQTLYSR